MKHRRLNFIPRTACISGLILLSLSGCKYDRSFMNIDSNSGSPFFGLQLAVDTGSRPPEIGELNARQKGSASPLDRLKSAPENAKSDSSQPPQLLYTRTAGTRPSGFAHASEMRGLNTDIRYSLGAPATDKLLHTQAIDLRISAF